MSIFMYISGSIPLLLAREEDRNPLSGLEWSEWNCGDVACMWDSQPDPGYVYIDLLSHIDSSVIPQKNTMTKPFTVSF